ncbi:hypothetical protein TIFTF001_035450 [Ficus carica]|uniref:Uncharacterized protein n=1 Tax=Ficus carica TaxID=3494 RepID=A0AA88E2B1_FICCA|nr:hypothetical protein TIFTF001_035450 [Ficus carica]
MGSELAAKGGGLAGSVALGRWLGGKGTMATRTFCSGGGGRNPRGRGGWRDSEFFGAKCGKEGENRRERVRKLERERENCRENGEESYLIWFILIFICYDMSSLIILIVVAINLENDVAFIEFIKKLFHA